MSYTQNYVGSIVVEPCCRCAMMFGIPSDFRARRLDDHVDFYCPAGHPQHFTGESDVSRLEKQLAAKQARLDQAHAEIENQQKQKERLSRRLNATRGVITKTKNRIANGVCPCCKRYFENVHRHISGQHPEYATKD